MLMAKFMKNLLQTYFTRNLYSLGFILLTAFSSLNLPLEGGKPASLRNSPDSALLFNLDLSV